MLNKAQHLACANVIVSTCHDPYTNLAFEDYLYRQPFDAPRLFLWQNSPTVVIGRAQNPWLECHLGKMASAGVNLARRQSGGGAVYHDLGNLNITLFSPIKTFDKRANLAFIRDVLGQFDVNARMTERHAIEVHDGHTFKKVSGSAFRQGRDMAFHHLTLLVSTNITTLNTCLHSERHIIGKGVKSVRADVINLHDINPRITVASLQQSLQKRFCKNNHVLLNAITVDHAHIRALPGVTQTSDTYCSFDWQYGKTHAFQEIVDYEHDGTRIPIRLHVKAGKLERIDSHQPLPQHVSERLQAAYSTPFNPDSRSK